MAACSLPVQSQCYLLNSSPVSTIDRYEICEQKLRAYLGNAADYTRLTITDDMCICREKCFEKWFNKFIIIIINTRRETITQTVSY